jgi:hypothetical protein
MRTYEAASTAPPEVAWALMARPGRWHEWAPQLRGAWGLGEPEVRAGSLGAARLLGALPLPARVTDKQPGRAWTWRLGLGVVELVHRVEPQGGEGEGSVIAVDLLAPGPLEPVAAAVYGPVVSFTLERLAREAERDAARMARG